jgi:eukaryotic-like serine/threonine-protein kinase
MEVERKCNECGQAIPADAKVCRPCLMAWGLEAPPTEDGGQRAEDGEQKTEDSRQRAEDRGRGTEDSDQESEGVHAQPGLAPAVGTSIRYFGDYELLEEIASGAMGVVYKARQVSLDRLVAVKMILAGPYATEAYINRFETEAKAVAQLKHPNIVAIHEVGQYEGQHYFSMDFVDGPNLSRLVHDHSLPARQAARYIHIIAGAIHFAHQNNILHRDLKPSNVVIDWNDQPRITDFGLAKRMDIDSSLSATGQLLGTPGYMAPEQVENKRGEVGPHSDVYSIGATL